MPRRTHGYEMDMDEEQDEGEPDAMENECDGGNPGGIEEARKLEEVGEDPMDFEMKMVKETHMIWQIRAGDQVVLVGRERAPLDARWDHQYSVNRVQGPVLTVVNMRTGKRWVINCDKVKLVDPDLEWTDVIPRSTRTARRPAINIPVPVNQPQLPAGQRQERTAARNPQPLKRRRTDSLDSYVSPPGVRRSQRLAEKKMVFWCPDQDTEGEGSGYLPRTLPQKRTRESGDYGEAKRRCFKSSQYWSVWAQSALQISSLRMVSTSREKAPPGSLSRYGLP